MTAGDEEVNKHDINPPNLYYFLWLKNQKSESFSGIKIPDTVIFYNRKPLHWYFTSKRTGQVLRKNQSKVTKANIQSEFRSQLPSKSTSFTSTDISIDIVAIVLYEGLDHMNNTVTFIEHLSPSGLRNLLNNHRKMPSYYILQRFIYPSAENNNVLISNWTSNGIKEAEVTQVANVNRLTDVNIPLSERLVTHEGPSCFSQPLIISNAKTVQTLTNVNTSISSHIAKSYRKRLASSEFYFRICTEKSSSQVLYLLYARSLEMPSVGEKSFAARDFEIPPFAVAEFQKDLKVEVTAPKCLSCNDVFLNPDSDFRVTYKAIIESTMAITAVAASPAPPPEEAIATKSSTSPLKSKDKAQRRGSTVSVIESPLSKFRNKAVKTAEDYSKVAAIYLEQIEARGEEQLANSKAGARRFACVKRNSSTITPAINDLNDKGGSKQPANDIGYAKRASVVPPLITSTYGKISFERYMQLSNDTDFLYKSVRVCEDCSKSISEKTIVKLQESSTEVALPSVVQERPKKVPTSSFFTAFGRVTDVPEDMKQHVVVAKPKAPPPANNQQHRRNRKLISPSPHLVQDIARRFRPPIFVANKKLKKRVLEMQSHKLLGLVKSLASFLLQTFGSTSIAKALTQYYSNSVNTVNIVCDRTREFISAEELCDIFSNKLEFDGLTLEGWIFLSVQLHYNKIMLLNETMSSPESASSSNEGWSLSSKVDTIINICDLDTLLRSINVEDVQFKDGYTSSVHRKYIQSIVNQKPEDESDDIQKSKEMKTITMTTPDVASFETTILLESVPHDVRIFALEEGREDGFDILLEVKNSKNSAVKRVMLTCAKILEVLLQNKVGNRNASISEALKDQKSFFNAIVSSLRLDVTGDVMINDTKAVEVRNDTFNVKKSAMKKKTSDFRRASKVAKRKRSSRISRKFSQPDLSAIKQLQQALMRL